MATDWKNIKIMALLLKNGLNLIGTNLQNLKHHLHSFCNQLCPMVHCHFIVLHCSWAHGAFVLAIVTFWGEVIVPKRAYFVMSIAVSI